MSLIPRITVGVVTHNIFLGLRCDLFIRTVKSIDAAFPGCSKILLDNGSSDGTDEFILGSRDISRDWQIICYKPADGVCTPGRGHNELIKHVLKQKPHVVVFSDDDMEWYPSAGSTLGKFWSAKPSDPVILCGLLEPEWHWNTPRETIERGGVKALVRDSCPGSGWTFLAESWSKIGPVFDGFGYDHKTCIALGEKGLRVAQIDLSEHLGWELSTHNNNAVAAEGNKPVDKKKWGLE